MAITIVIIIVSILALPYLFVLWLYGVTLLKRLFEEGNWTHKKGLEQTVRTWNKLTPEERMDATLQQESGTVPTGGWIKSPTADEEIRQRNEQAFEEGLIHKTPEGRFEEAKPEISRPLP